MQKKIDKKRDIQSEYLRDGRSPKPKHERTSIAMRANRSTDTGPELMLRRALSELGIKGYRLHWKKVHGRPDITFPKIKIAIFVNGCFWHRCPYCKLPLPKSHKYFWSRKFSNNKERDKIKSDLLRRMGWKVFVIWECRIKKNVKGWAMILRKAIRSRSN